MTFTTRESILIKAARKKTGLNQSDFGALMGMQVSSIGRFEQGTKKPQFDFIQRIKNILKTPQEELNIYVSQFKAQRDKLITQLQVVS